MSFLNTYLIRKSIFLLAAATLSVSAVAIDFNQTLRLANQGHAKSQYELGRAYKQGEGVRQDYAKAVEWYTKAAKQGFAGPQYNLGSMYYEGLGVRHDYSKAVKWYTKAANQSFTGTQYSEANKQGVINAQYSLGFMYYRGTPKLCCRQRVVWESL